MLDRAYFNEEDRADERRFGGSGLPPPQPVVTFPFRFIEPPLRGGHDSCCHTPISRIAPIRQRRLRVEHLHFAIHLNRLRSCLNLVLKSNSRPEMTDADGWYNVCIRTKR